MARIYLASSWKNSFQESAVRVLRMVGHEVYDFKNPPGRAGFAWESISKNYQKWSVEDYLKALKTAKVQAGFFSDMGAMGWADTCVLLLPCGRSAHLEAGWFVGQGKKLIVVLCPESYPDHPAYTGQADYDLMYLMTPHIVTSLEDVVRILR